MPWWCWGEVTTRLKNKKQGYILGSPSGETTYIWEADADSRDRRLVGGRGAIFISSHLTGVDLGKFEI